MSIKNVPFSERIAVSISEAVQLTGMGRTRIYEEVKAGTLRSKKLGRRRLVFVDSIKEWIASREANDDAETSN